MNFLKEEVAIFHANVVSNEERGERKNRTYITQWQNCFKIGHFSQVAGRCRLLFRSGVVMYWESVR